MRSSNKRSGSVHWFAARASGPRKTAALRKRANAVLCATKRAESASGRRRRRQVRPRARRPAVAAVLAVAAARSFAPNAVVAPRFPRIAGSSTARAAPEARVRQAWAASASLATSDERRPGLVGHYEREHRLSTALLSALASMAWSYL